MTKEPSTLEKEKFLQNIWAFQRLDPEHLHALAQLAVTRKFPKDSMLWLQGQKVTFFTLVYDGQIRSVRGSASGSEKLLSIIKPGFHFGLAEMITGATSAVTLVADRDTTILAISQNSLQKFLLSHAEICYRLMQTMAHAIFSLTRDLERATFENAHTRLARMLLQQRRNDLLPASLTTSKELTHKDLAIRMGVSRETVSRVLADFRDKGLIDTGYRTIKILDRDGLMEYVEDFDQW